MTTILKTTPAPARKLHRLVRKQCGNCDDGNCLLLDDGDSRQFVQLLSIYGIYCKYFLTAVLLADKELYQEIIEHNRKNKNKFDRCDAAERKPL